ncbi:MAG: hypothetical protein DMG80_17885 [Acidobacteria bacterium]|nr:MAG: hypothetical protein DMG80_17885 [Acidobacteriota bacterium]
MCLRRCYRHTLIDAGTRVCADRMALLKNEQAMKHLGTVRVTRFRASAATGSMLIVLMKRGVYTNYCNLNPMPSFHLFRSVLSRRTGTAVIGGNVPVRHDLCDGMGN